MRGFEEGGRNWKQRASQKSIGFLAAQRALPRPDTTDLQHPDMKEVHSWSHPGAWCCHTRVLKDKEVEDTMLAKD